MADHGRCCRDHLDPGVLGRDHELDRGHGQHAFEEIPEKRDSGSTTTERAQHICRSRAPAAVRGQVDVLVDPADDHARRDGAQRIANHCRNDNLLPGNQVRNSPLTAFVHYRLHMPGHLAVVNAGGWGTALAVLLGRAGHHVRLWCRGEALLAQMSVGRENPVYLPGVKIPACIWPTTSLEDAVAGAEAV